MYFWNRTLHVSERFSVHHQESSTVYTATGMCHTGFADCLLIRSGWNPDPISRNEMFHLVPASKQPQNLYNIYLML
jgi:hypothetical protein